MEAKNQQMSPKEEDGYVWREVPMLKRIKIPEGSIKCPDCDGEGKIRFRWSEPSFGSGNSDFLSCITCGGKGFEKKEFLEKWKK
jgi:hypothetical protein